MGRYGCDFGFPFMMGGNMFFWVIVFLVAIGLIFYFANRSKENSPQTSSRAAEILDEKYAQGEINEEEYLDKKRNLQK